MVIVIIMVIADAVITIDVIAMINGNDRYDDGRSRGGDCHNKAMIDDRTDDCDDSGNR